MRSGREDWTAGARGQIRTSRAEREQVIDALKGAFIEGRLAKDEFDQRVGQVFGSRTYAQLGALIADIPGGLASALRPAGQIRRPAKAMSVRTAASVGAIGAVPSMASAAVGLMQSGAAVPAVAGLLLVGLTGVLVTSLLATLLIVLSWAVRRSQRRRAQAPPSGPADLAPGRGDRRRRLPPAGQDDWRTAEATRIRLPRPQLSPVQCRGGILATGGC